MRLEKFDLNLLVAFDTLVSEGSVTGAARRLGVTQSAMSAALKRLRESLNDDILVQDGKRMIPTPTSLMLAPEVRAVIQQVRGLLATGTTFDPLISNRCFHIAASDYIATVVIAPLAKRLGSIAPGVSMKLSSPRAVSPLMLSQGELDLFLTPEQFTNPDQPRELLFEERYVIVGCVRNRMLEKMDRHLFSQCGHVAVHIEGRQTYAEQIIRDLGIERRVEIEVPSFIQVPWLLPGTNRIALMHERLACLLAADLRLAIVPAPFDIQPMREMIQYHSTREKDAGLIWLRAQLHAVAKEQQMP